MVREEPHVFVVMVPKATCHFEVTVLKSEEILEWFMSAYAAATDAVVWSDWCEHWAIGNESQQEVEQELEQSVCWFLDRIREHEVRLVQKPKLRLLGVNMGLSPRLEIKSAAGWRDLYFTGDAE